MHILAKTMNLILSLARSNRDIRAVFQTGSQVNPLVERDDMQDYDVIFAVNDFDNFELGEDFLTSLDYIFLYLTRERKLNFTDPGEEYSYIILLANGVKIDITIIPVESISKLTSSETLLSLVMDKDNLISQLAGSSDIGHRMLRPTKNEFEKNNYDFFYAVIELLPSLYRSNLTRASLNYRKLVDRLLTSLAWQTSYNADFKLDLGRDYAYLEKFMEDKYKRAYFDAISYRDINELWQALFACLALFRKLGLSLSTRLNYDYPKKLDVAMVDYVREVWQKTKRNQEKMDRENPYGDDGF